MKLHHTVVGALALLTWGGCRPAAAETMTPEQVMATIQALQSRVAALESSSRRDRADAVAARAELRASKGARLSHTIRYAAASSPPPAPPLIPSNADTIHPLSSFDGFYAAAIGGYQFGSQKQISYGFFTSPNLAAASGGSVGAAIGYNVQSNGLLIGFEGRARKDFSYTVDKSISYQPGFASYPFVISSYCCSYERPAGRYPLPFPGGFGLSYGYAKKDVAEREYGGDLSLRAGIVFGDTLIFARFGGGVDAIRRASKADFTSTASCNQSVGYEEVLPSGTVQNVVTGCAAVSRGGIVKSSNSKAQPYAILGAGVEQNFGPMFVRVEGALLNHLPAFGNGFFGSSYYVTTEVTGAVGYRF